MPYSDLRSQARATIHTFVDFCIRSTDDLLTIIGILDVLRLGGRAKEDNTMTITQCESRSSFETSNDSNAGCLHVDSTRSML
jgi:hypothetical protein